MSQPVEHLTTQQIQAIYTGQLTNWQELGGADLLITPYQRNDNSGSHELMKELVMQGLKMVDAPDLFLLTSMIAPFNAISTDPSGIG